MTFGSRAPEGAPVATVLSGHVDRLALFAPLLGRVEPFPQAQEAGISGILGSREDVRVLVLGTGMGGPATVRALRLARDFGASVAVRAGGAGPVRDGVGIGDVIIGTAAVRDEGTSNAFLPPTHPAVADPGVVRRLCEAAEHNRVSATVGVLHSKDSFFGETDPDASPMSDELRRRWATWQRLGVVGSEMEAAALFAAAPVYGIRAGAVLRVNDVVNETGGLRPVETTLCEIAVAGAVSAVQDGAP